MINSTDRSLSNIQPAYTFNSWMEKRQHNPGFQTSISAYYDKEKYKIDAEIARQT